MLGLDRTLPVDRVAAFDDLEAGHAQGDGVPPDGGGPFRVALDGDGGGRWPLIMINGKLVAPYPLIGRACALLEAQVCEASAQFHRSEIGRMLYMHAKHLGSPRARGGQISGGIPGPPKSRCSSWPLARTETMARWAEASASLQSRLVCIPSEGEATRSLQPTQASSQPTGGIASPQRTQFRTTRRLREVQLFPTSYPIPAGRRFGGANRKSGAKTPRSATR